MAMKVQSSPIPEDHLQWPFYLEQLQSFFAVFQTGITERVPQGHPDVNGGAARMKSSGLTILTMKRRQMEDYRTLTQTE